MRSTSGCSGGPCFFQLELPQTDPATLDNLSWDENDSIALSRDLNGHSPWLEGQVTVGHLLGVAVRLRESPRAVYERLQRWATLFHLELPQTDPATLDSLSWDENDRIALSRDLDGRRHWLEGQVTAGHLFGVAVRLRESPRAVYERLQRWAALFHLELPQTDPATLDNLSWDENDRIVLSRALNGRRPWLEGQVTVGHLLAAAVRLRESPRAVYERLQRWATLFHLELPQTDPTTLDSLSWDENDRIALTHDLDGGRLWLEGQVTVGHLLEVAVRLRESPRAVYERLQRWATLFQLELPQTDLATLDNLSWDENDRIVLSRALNGRRPWLEGQVNVGHLLAAAARLRESPRAVYERLQRWATFFYLELPQTDPATLDNLSWDENDSIALSHDLNGSRPWLEGPVSATHIRLASWLLGESEQEILQRLQRFDPVWLQLPVL